MLEALARSFAHPMVGNDNDQGGRVPQPSDSFPEQWAYVTSDALFNAVCCSRRAGKTTGAVMRALRLMGTRPGTRVHYVTLIRRNCRKLFWRPLLAELDRRGWEYEANETDLIVSLANGSWLQAMSCDDLRDVKAVKGDRSSLFMVDECQENLDDVLRALIDVAATPMLTDSGGMLDLLGTVPEVEPCFFSEALDSPGWRAFSWTMFDHDFPDTRGVKRQRVQEILDKRGLTWDSPLAQREYLGRRVRDPSTAAYEYEPKRNDYEPAAVDFETGTWRHALGLDLGFQDNDAIVVVGWDREDAERRLYVRHVWQASHQDVDQLAATLKDVIAAYRPSYFVGDHGGHGAVKVLETLANRLRVSFAIKPPDVMVSVGLVNDDLRTGRLLVPAGSELGRELPRVQRSENATTRKVEINKRGHHSDLTEALRYAHHAARHYANRAPKPEPTRDELRARAAADEWRREHRRNPWS